MLKRALMLLTAAALVLSLTACRKKEPQQFEIEVESPKETSAPAPSVASSEPEEQGVVWKLEPRTDLEIAMNLAEYPQPYDPDRAAGLANQNELAFFGQDGGFGVIDQQGNIVIPASEDVLWCSMCGITNHGESKIFDGSGQDVGYGGHGGNMFGLFFEEGEQTWYTSDYGMISKLEQPMDEVVQAAPVIRLTKAEDEFNCDYYLWDEETQSQTPVDSESSGKWILKGLDGQPLLGGMQFEEIGGLRDPISGVQLTNIPAREGRIAVKENGMWRFIREDGSEAVPAVFEEVRPFLNGVAAVKTETGWGYIDRTGKALTPMTFEGAATAGENGLAWVKTEEGWGVIDLAENPAK